MKKKGKKKLKSGFRIVLKLLLLIIIVSLCTYYVLNIKIKNIYITGNEQVRDIEIIEVADIKDYPKIYRLSKRDLMDKISSLPLVKDSCWF